MITKDNGADLHEALVHRGAVQREMQPLIFVKENVILVHHQCHIDYGQTKTMLRACLYEICQAVGARYVGRWYRSLWQDHGLNLRRGILLPKKGIPMYICMGYLERGAELGRRQLPQGEDEWLIGRGTRHARDFRALCVKRWQGKTIKKIDRPPSSWAGYSVEVMLRLIRDGYWFDYLSYTFGFDPQEVANGRYPGSGAGAKKGEEG